jgi:uncharacterized lipoprotein YmbA
VNIPKLSLNLAAYALLACACTGCVNLKRTADPAHFYVLSAHSSQAPPASIASTPLAVGLGNVEIPSYLLDRRIVVRRGAHEVSYLENDRWAERLDRGIQRVVAANLATVVPSDRVLQSAWRRNDVGAEVYITIHRCESDQDGRVVLEAHWRIASPGGETTWLANQLNLAKRGPTFRGDPGAAVDGLSRALADLSQQIASDLRALPLCTPASTGEPR